MLKIAGVTAIGSKKSKSEDKEHSHAEIINAGHNLPTKFDIRKVALLSKSSTIV